MVFIHKSEDTQLVASMHSVTFLNDEGFWFYDLNIGGIKKIDCISSLGQLGERFLIEKMMRINSTRRDFAQRWQELIDNYNAGSTTQENYFNDLVDFTERLKEEEERHIKEGLTEDELELYDILKKEKMTKEEEKRVKLAAKSLLGRLIEEHPRVLVQDWYKDSQTRLQVKSAIEEVLHTGLPETYDRRIFSIKCSDIYNLIYDYAQKGSKWAA